MRVNFIIPSVLKSTGIIVLHKGHSFFSNYPEHNIWIFNKNVGIEIDFITCVISSIL